MTLRHPLRQWLPARRHRAAMSRRHLAVERLEDRTVASVGIQLPTVEDILAAAADANYAGSLGVATGAIKPQVVPDVAGAEPGGFYVPIVPGPEATASAPAGTEPLGTVVVDDTVEDADVFTLGGPEFDVTKVMRNADMFGGTMSAQIPQPSQNPTPSPEELQRQQFLDGLQQQLLQRQEELQQQLFREVVLNVRG